MDGAIWYAIYKNGKKIEENSNLPHKGLLALDEKRVEKFGLKGANWDAYFTRKGSFFFNNSRALSALSDGEIGNFELICYNKVVLDDLAGDASRGVYLVFGYRMDNKESILIVEPTFPAYCFLRKTISQDKEYYAVNDKLINQKQYNFILNF